MKMMVQSEKLAVVVAKALVDQAFKETLIDSPRFVLDQYEVFIPEELTIRVTSDQMTSTIQTDTEYVLCLPEITNNISLEEIEQKRDTVEFGPNMCLPFCAVYLED